MTNALEKTRTELDIEKADYNVGLKEADFTRRELERGAAARAGWPAEPCPDCSLRSSIAGAFR